jgi:hypothetical protein
MDATVTVLEVLTGAGCHAVTFGVCGPTTMEDLCGTA